MSRIGKQPIIVPDGVTVTLGDGEAHVKGPKGELVVPIASQVSVAQEGNEVVVSIPEQASSEAAAFWGLTRSLLANAVVGVHEGFSKQLEVNGVGYKVALKGSALQLHVGYSHPVDVSAPDGITFAVEGNVITVTGIDKQLVGEVSANIRKIRKPEPYKGKGIKYMDEVIRRKEGKVMKSGE